MITKQDVINNEYQNALEMRRPFIQLRPALYADGDQWCALYGPNLQIGVSGFGGTPEKASIAFDIAWLNAKTPESTRHRLACTTCDGRGEIGGWIGDITGPR